VKQNARGAPFADLFMPLIAVVLLLLLSGLDHTERTAAAAEAPRSTSPAPRSNVLVTGVRSTSSDGYARITVELSQETRFEVRQLLDNLG